MTQLGGSIKNNYANIAQLKDIMTIPPMTAKQHAEVMRKRNQHRRSIEEAKERKELATADTIGSGVQPTGA